MGRRAGWPSRGGLRLPFSVAKSPSADLGAGAHGHRVSRPSLRPKVQGNGHGYKGGGLGRASVEPLLPGPVLGPSQSSCGNKTGSDGQGM